MEENMLRHSLVSSKDEMDSKYKKTVKKVFDYEKNTSLNEEKYKVDVFNDCLVQPFYNCESVSIFKKNFIKSLVSKKKIRFTNKEFDLDLIYVTKRVIAMGFPSVSCESLYRNSLYTVKSFFSKYHDQNVKVYNLCIEEERIYDRERFDGLKVGLFPSTDHSSCPIKLMLEFCVDLCIYLTENEKGIGAVHCKAGKGRTGLMICCYLLFSGICEDSRTAMVVYAERRSYINKGVTIPSQKRYINHFETFLKCNFNKPYFKMIPKITKTFLSPSTSLLYNMLKDRTFHDFINIFKLKKIKVGPFDSKPYLRFIIENFRNQTRFNSEDKLEKRNFNYYIKESFSNSSNKTTVYYAIISFNEDFLIDSDINLVIKGRKASFNAWLNFYFITLEYFFKKIWEIKGSSNSPLVNPLSPREIKDDNLSEVSTGSKNTYGNTNLFEMRDFSKILRNKTTFTDKYMLDSIESKVNKFPVRPREVFDANGLVKNGHFNEVDFIQLVYILNSVCGFNNENILKFDLNNIVNSIFKDEREIKIKLDTFSLDKFKQKLKMAKDFSVSVTYGLV